MANAIITLIAVPAECVHLPNDEHRDSLITARSAAIQA